MQLLLVLILMLPAIVLHAQANRSEIVIDEIMADPVPAVTGGLPQLEYIELKNVSGKTFNLKGWKLDHGTGTATIRDSFLLGPDRFVLLCASAGRDALLAYGDAIAITAFPSLDNDGEAIALVSDEGKFIHGLYYTKNWYRNAVKSEGGWSLEMIDPLNPCSGASNWMASNSAVGGTPGAGNSVNAVNRDAEPPVLVHGFAIDSLEVALVFDEPLDSLAAVDPSKYSITGGVGPPVSATVVAPGFNRVNLRLTNPVLRDTAYTVTASAINDCSSNSIGSLNAVRIGWASIAGPADVVINEILFNPKEGGSDYVEIYNRSSHIIDAKDLYLANRTGNGPVGSVRPLAMENRLLFPGGYLVITEDPEAVMQQYSIRNPAAFGETVMLPALPGDRGTVVILNASGTILDEVSYSESWHFKLIENKRGVALERIDYNKPAQDASNWHSAATDAGYGTPGSRNSQFRADEQGPGVISIATPVFSPDNDGNDDYAVIQYRFPEPGYVCSITLFDETGRPVRFLTRNAICGLSGRFLWDGLDESQHPLHMGIYLALTEVFHLKGRTRKYKNPVVLARKLE